MIKYMVLSAVLDHRQCRVECNLLCIILSCVAVCQIFGKAVHVDLYYSGCLYQCTPHWGGVYISAHLMGWCLYKCVSIHSLGMEELMQIPFFGEG